MSHVRRRRTFTVQEANAALPLVRAIVQDLVEASLEVVDRRERLAYLIGGRGRDSQDPYREELAQIEDELESQTRQLQEYVQELRDLGVEPKSATEGLIDFPAILDGRLVYLCWKLGEPEVLHWHQVDAGFAGRQPLTADSVAGDSLGEAEEGI